MVPPDFIVTNLDSYKFAHILAASIILSPDTVIQWTLAFAALLVAVAVFLFSAARFLSLFVRPFYIQDNNVEIVRIMDARKVNKISTNEQNLAPLKIFVCHSSQDILQSKILYKKLCLDNFSPWLAEEELIPGQDWDLEILKALEISDVVLILLSMQSVDRVGYMQKEIGMALNIAANQPEGRIFIIPVRLGKCEVPVRLKKWHWVNLFEPSGYERLRQPLDRRHLNLE